MKRFSSSKNIIIKTLYIYIISLIIINTFLFKSFYIKLGDNVSYFAKIKIDEINKYYLNITLKKYLNIKTNDYIKTNIVNNNIVNVDIDNERANILLNNIIKDLEKNIMNIEKGYINKYHNLEMLKGKNGIVIFIPSGVIFNSPMLSNIGPTIPVKVNFLENIYAYIDVVVENYGINNSLIKLYVIINIDEMIEIPIDNKYNKLEYKFLISSKIINGAVPNILGNTINESSNIVNK